MLQTVILEKPNRNLEKHDSNLEEPVQEERETVNRPSPGKILELSRQKRIENLEEVIRYNEFKIKNKNKEVTEAYLEIYGITKHTPSIEILTDNTGGVNEIQMLHGVIDNFLTEEQEESQEISTKGILAKEALKEEKVEIQKIALDTYNQLLITIQKSKEEHPTDAQKRINNKREEIIQNIIQQKKDKPVTTLTNHYISRKRTKIEQILKKFEEKGIIHTNELRGEYRTSTSQRILKKLKEEGKIITLIKGIHAHSSYQNAWNYIQNKTGKNPTPETYQQLLKEPAFQQLHKKEQNKIEDIITAVTYKHTTRKRTKIEEALNEFEEKGIIHTNKLREKYGHSTSQHILKKLKEEGKIITLIKGIHAHSNYQNAWNYIQNKTGKNPTPETYQQLLKEPAFQQLHKKEQNRIKDITTVLTNHYTSKKGKNYIPKKGTKVKQVLEDFLERGILITKELGEKYGKTTIAGSLLKLMEEGEIIQIDKEMFAYRTYGRALKYIIDEIGKNPDPLAYLQIPQQNSFRGLPSEEKKRVKHIIRVKKQTLREVTYSAILRGEKTRKEIKQHIKKHAPYKSCAGIGFVILDLTGKGLIEKRGIEYVITGKPFNYEKVNKGANYVGNTTFLKQKKTEKFSVEEQKTIYNSREITP